MNPVLIIPFQVLGHPRGVEYHARNRYGVLMGSVLGLLGVLAVPSILRVLVATRRSSSVRTAYQRYVSTMQHTLAWYDLLEPGTKSWKSLKTVRTRHLRASRAHGDKVGRISQKDLALTQFGFFGFPIVKPEMLGVQQDYEGVEGFIHLWRTVGYMIGLQDKYNLARETLEETRQACQIVMMRVYTPCLMNPTEYYYHMTKVTVNALELVATLRYDAAMHMLHRLADVPGFHYRSEELQDAKLKLKSMSHYLDKSYRRNAANGLNGKISENAYKRKDVKVQYDFLSLEDYENHEQNNNPFKNLKGYSKFLFHIAIFIQETVYNTYLGRLYFNFKSHFSEFVMKWCPIFPILKVGWKIAFVDMFKETIRDDAVPKTNAEMLPILFD